MAKCLGGPHMNPANPTNADVRMIEQVFMRQMQMLSRRANRPMDPLRSLDFQCSDGWL